MIPYPAAQPSARHQPSRPKPSARPLPSPRSLPSPQAHILSTPSPLAGTVLRRCNPHAQLRPGSWRPLGRKKKKVLLKSQILRKTFVCQLPALSWPSDDHELVVVLSKFGRIFARSTHANCTSLLWLLARKRLARISKINNYRFVVVKKPQLSWQ